ncbi:hypothetical protein ACX80U_18735 [Arthrobacter sp. TmT3-37]
MTEKTEVTPVPIESIEQMVNEVALSSIDYFELSARSKAGFGDDIGADENQPPEIKLTIQGIAGKFRVRLHVFVAAALGEVVVDLAVTYDLDEKYEVPQDIGVDFANRVGVMALLPYVREAIHSQTSKVFGEGLLMPILRAGDLEFSQEESVVE